MRFVSSPRVAAAVFVLTCAAAPAAAQDRASEDRHATTSSLQDAIAAIVEADTAAVATPAVSPPAAPPRRRPAVLVPLYVSFGALQVLDAHSTARALATGAAREANPVMTEIAGSRAALMAVKAAATAGVILGGERISKKHRAAAIIFMTALDSGMALVVEHNYRIAR